MNCEAVGERFDSFTTQFVSGSVVYWQGHRPLKAETGVRLPPELFKSSSVWLRRDRCPAGSHKAGPPGSIPGPEMSRAYFEMSRARSFHLASTARYANWYSDQVENLMSVGSNPTRATGNRRRMKNVPWSSGNDASLTKRKRGFDSLRDDLRFSGSCLTRSASAVAAFLSCKQGGRVQFSGGPFLAENDEETGCWSNGTTPGLQPGNRGSTPRRSTLLDDRC